jgi:hypothetical protein
LIKFNNSFKNLTYIKLFPIFINFLKVYLGVSVLISILSVIELILRSFSNLRITFSQTFFDSIELATIIFFTVEIFLRFYCCPSKLEFIKSPINIIDLITNLSYYLYFPLSKVKELSKIKKIGIIFRTIVILKCLRLAPGLDIMSRILVKGFKEISLFLAYVVISVLVISSIMYEIENEYNTDFDSIPASFWWAVSLVIFYIFKFKLQFILNLDNYKGYNPYNGW